MKLMPGMLTAEQLKLLDEARGKDFDRRFMEFMIQHHQGAISMVQKLFAIAGRDAERVRIQVRVGRRCGPERRDRTDAAHARERLALRAA